jgi:hypothetical protein
VIGMTDPHVDGHKPFWTAIRWYGKLTGASATYTFFSPNIPREVMFRFTIYQKDGAVIETTLQDTANNEVRARLGNILRMIPRNFKNKMVVRSLAASVTASMFKIYPDAEKISIRGVIFELPVMEDYHNGVRTTFRQVYSATFARTLGV